MATTQTFAFDMKNISADWGDRLDGILRQSIQDVSEAVIEGTPVDTGFARASWWGELGPEPTGHPSPPPEPEIGEYGYKESIGDGAAMALSQVSLVLLDIKPGATFGLYNNAEYIVDLEYGKSRQAPIGMMRINIMRWPSIVTKWAERLAK